MPFAIAVTVGVVLIVWGVTLRLLRPDAGRCEFAQTTGDPSVDLSLQAAIPAGSGIGQVLFGMVVVLTALATLVVA